MDWLKRILSKRSSEYLKWSWKRRGLIARSIFCMLVGVVSFWFNQGQDFDVRFNLRSTNNPSPEFVILDLKIKDFEAWDSSHLFPLLRIKEIDSYSDNRYWQWQAWEKLLSNILQHNPKAVGVSLFFNKDLMRTSDLTDLPEVFSDSRVLWSSRTDEDGRILEPLFAKTYNINVGNHRLDKDDDGIVRRFRSIDVAVPHLSVRLANTINSKDIHSFDKHKHINFQGPANTYMRIGFEEVITGQVPSHLINNKIIIIGASDNEKHFFRTPLGEMSRAEIIANLSDILSQNKWIKTLPDNFYLFLLFLGLLFCLYIVNTYPHSVAFVFLLWGLIFYTATALWSFDQFYLWLPILSPALLTLIVFIVFLSYQLTIKDTQNWKLEQEKKYITEIEEMKQNFISLFSHDLKTPIAKIQAICDRAIAENKSNEVKDDLHLLRRESQQLHRYIQSILKMTRVESKEFKLTKEATDINELTFEVVEQLKELAKPKGQSIDLQLEPLFLIEADTPLIREVILNLAENAIKYSPEGANIEISTYERNDEVILKVKDSGKGIPQIDQNSVFDRFYRGSDQLNKTKGSGLGLYLSKYFIELHGGKIWLESTPETGTTIQFSLPV